MSDASGKAPAGNRPSGAGAPDRRLLMLCTIGLVLGFQSSSKLAAACGVAVTATMLVQNVKHNRVVHANVVILHFETENVPRVPNFEKVETQKLGGGFYRIVAHRGFMEEPKMDRILSLAHEQGLTVNPEETSYCVGREKLSVGPNPALGRWRANLFIFMSRNAMDAASFFGIPPDRMIEIGVPLQL